MRFDWTTFGLELLNFVVLVFVLRRVLYRPLRRALEERRAAHLEAVASIDDERRRLAEARAAIDDEHAAIAALRDRVRAEATEDAAAERARILTQAREDAAAERARVHALLTVERDAAEAWVRSVAVERGTELAGRMLERLAPHAVEDALRDALLDALETRGAELARECDDVELVGARLPDDRQVAAVRARVDALLGRKAHLTVKEDESLRGGLVLRVGDFVLDASLAGQLAGLRELARDVAQETPE